MKNYNMLIVEDEPVIAMHLQSILEKMGYGVLGICDSCEDTLNFLYNSGTKPNLIFMDIRLFGDEDGIQTANKIKEKGFDIPVIYLTSNADKNTLGKAKLTQPVAFLKKPFDPEQLQATLEISIHRTEELTKERIKLEKINSLNQMQIDELMETQQHLITATWRERELKEELQTTKAIIETQNKKILDSINYAKRIQTSIIPKSEELKKALGDYFLFYKPKDVVSGDFPWMFLREDYVYIAAVDCTGHGVPGAMMSLIGFLLLNDVASHKTIPTPADILNGLHKGVVKTLRQDAEGNKAADGMDVAICRIHKGSGKILYSGAHRPLYHLINDEIVQYKGDKFPIGGMQYNGANHFTDANFTVNKGEAIYFFSDGLPDQFGGEEKLKFGPKRIRNIIIENRNLTMENQKTVFYEAFKDWTSDYKQIDDVLLIGIKF